MTGNLLAQTVSGMNDVGLSSINATQVSILESFGTQSDLIVQSRAGTGKSTSIGLIVSEFCGRMGTSLICVPNSKLVTQTVSLLAKMLLPSRCCVEAFHGNIATSIAPYYHGVIVGEPSDLATFNLHTSRLPVKLLVFDEADQLFGDEAISTSKGILSRFLNPSVKTLFLSATFPPNIISRIEEALVIADSSRHEPPCQVKLCVSTSTNTSKNPVVSHVRKYYAIIPDSSDPENLVSQIIKRERKTLSTRVIVFGGKAVSRHLSQNLEADGLKAVIITSSENIPDCDIFLDPRRYLSRGVNIDRLGLGISISVPETKEEILHQWGRIGRDSKSGKFVMVIEQSEIPQLEYLSFQLGVEFEEYKIFSTGSLHPFEVFSSTRDRLSFTQDLVSSSVR